MKKLFMIFKTAGLINLLTLSLTPVVLFFAFSAAHAQTWQQVVKRTQAQKSAALSGGEGWQRVPSACYAPSDPNIVYVCVDTEGMWKSIDGGTSWTRKTGEFPASGGLSVNVDPTNSSIVYVAGSSFLADQAATVEGIIRTADGGDTWTLVKAAHFHASYTYGGSHFAFGTGTTNVYAAPSTGGVLKSTNGTTWNLLTTSGGASILSSLNLYTIKGHPTNSTILYVTATDGLYKILDVNGSATVTKIGTGIPAGSNHQITIGSSTPSTMYVAADNDGVYRSTDSGVNFSSRNNGLTSIISAGGKARYIAMSPVNANKLYVTFENTVTGLFGKQIYYSSDAGVNWVQTTSMDESNAGGWIHGSEFGWETNLSGLNTGNRWVITHPTNQSIALAHGWGGCIKKTINGGETWQYSNTGFTGSLAGMIGGPSAIGWDANNSNRAAFSHSDWGTLVTADNEDTFVSRMTASYSGAKATHAIAMNGDNIVAVVGQYGATSVFISRNAGLSWVDTGGTHTTDMKFVSFHPQNSNIVYAGYYRIDNVGTSNTYYKSSRMIEGIYKGNGNIVYSHNSNSTVYKSTDKGVTWTTPYPSLSLPVGYNIYAMAVDPTDPDRLYFAVKGKGIYIINDVSADGGTAVLKNNSHGLALDQFGGNNVSCVAVDPNDANNIYAGCFAAWAGNSNGVFRSRDKGLTWTNINGNLGTYLTVCNITINPFDSYIYLGTFAGSWKWSGLDAGTGTPGAAPSATTGTVTVVTSTTATLNATLNANGSATTGRFQYGTNPGSYTTNTGSQTVSAGTSSVGISQAITGLTGSTTYYVRCQANSANGSTNGSETTFSTLQRYSLNVSMGTPTVNGDLSDWPLSLTNSIAKIIYGSSTGASGSWSAKWNNSGLFVAMTGSDTTLYADSGNNTYLDDGLELYVNRDGNLDATVYDDFDYHLGWNYKGTFTVATNGTTTGITVGTSSASGGYAMEIFVPWAVFPGGIIPGSGTVIGADVQINGDDNGGSRDLAKGWNNPANTNYFNPSGFGELILIGEGTGGGSAGTATVSIIKDTYVNEAAPTVNYGTNTGLDTRKGAVGFRKETLLEADIGNPGSVTAVMLNFYSLQDTTNTITYNLYPINSGSWAANIVTWNTKPGTQSTSIATFDGTDTVRRWRAIDITNYAQTIGTSTLSLDISGQAGVDNTTFSIYSYDKGGTTTPYFTVSHTGSGSDTVNPVGTVTANSNGTYTTSTGVTLDLSATDDIGITGYYVSGSTTTPYGTQSGWIAFGTVTPYSANVPYTLSAGDGTKTVYVWYKDGVNNISNMAQDSIILDATSPNINIVSPWAINYTMSDGSKALGTTAASVVIDGSSIDTNGVASVTWSSSGTSTTGTATGTTDFTTTQKILPVMSEGLVGYWKLDETSGSIAYDSSPLFTANGSITGASVGTLSVFGGSRYFNGVDSKISIGDPADGHLDFGTTTSFSFGCSKYSSSFMGNTDYLIAKRGFGVGYAMYAGNTWFVFISQGTGTYVSSSFTATPNNYLNQWVDLYAVVDRESQKLKTFLNGVQVGTASISVGAGSVANTSVFMIGARSDSLDPNKGYIDNVRIENRALSNTEVLQLHELATPDQVNTFSLTAQDTPGNQGTDTVSMGAFPAIATDFATAITRNSATLNSICSANNNSTNVWFNYGVTSGYYTGSSTTGTVTGATDTTVSISLGALASATTIYYKACATNAVNTVYGNEFSFDTLQGNTISTNNEYNYRSLFNSTKFRENILKANDIDLKFRKKMKNSQNWEDLKNDPDGFLSDLVDEPIK